MPRAASAPPSSTAAVAKRSRAGAAPGRDRPPPLEPQGAARLTREDWLDAAHAVVVDAGFDAARVLSLSQRLGVTRGSFYWHFGDHAELISALVTRWCAQELAAVQAASAQLRGDPQQDLDRLLDAALAHGGAQLENMRFELAMRGLARHDAEVEKQLTQVDRARLTLFEAQFRRLGHAEPHARDLAALLYLTVVGSIQALSQPGARPQLKAYLRQLIAQRVLRAGTP